MRKPDLEVMEVLCSETGKPMPKIPLWMADVKVKFVSDEARQKHSNMPGLSEIEPLRRSSASISSLDDIKIVEKDEDDGKEIDPDAVEMDVDEEIADEEFEETESET